MAIRIGNHRVYGVLQLRKPPSIAGLQNTNVLVRNGSLKIIHISSQLTNEKRSKKEKL